MWERNKEGRLLRGRGERERIKNCVVLSCQSKKYLACLGHACAARVKCWDGWMVQSNIAKACLTFSSPQQHFSLVVHIVELGNSKSMTVSAVSISVTTTSRCGNPCCREVTC